MTLDSMQSSFSSIDRVNKTIEEEYFYIEPTAVCMVHQIYGTSQTCSADMAGSEAWDYSIRHFSPSVDAKMNV